MRAHAKAHKSSGAGRALLEALRAAGCDAPGFCAQTVSEAEALAPLGEVLGAPVDVLVSNQTVGAGKVARLAALAADARMTLSACVDSLENARDVGAACEAAGATLDAVVEVDVGQRRCGTPTASAAADLAEAIAMGDVPGLRFKGLQCYHGGIQHVRALDARAAAAAEAHAKAREAVGACVERGIAVEYVTGGGTGTFEYELASGLYTELQPGSYFFMDGDYGRNEWESGALPEQAMWVLATVISAHEGNDYVVVDTGSKAVSTDAGPPRVRVAPSLGECGEAPGGDADALVYACAGDEHGIISLAEGAGEGAELPRLGSKLFLAPGHVDPTTNMHKHWIVIDEDDVVEDVWPIEAQGPGL